MSHSKLDLPAFCFRDPSLNSYITSPRHVPKSWLLIVMQNIISTKYCNIYMAYIQVNSHVCSANADLPPIYIRRGFNIQPQIDKHFWWSSSTLINVTLKQSNESFTVPIFRPEQLTFIEKQLCITRTFTSYSRKSCDIFQCLTNVISVPVEAQ